MRIFLSLACIAVLTPVPAFAKLPDLDMIFWGEVRHNGGQALVPLSPGNIQVIAKLNGLIVAQTSVAPGESRFVLKVPKDDGLTPRLPGTTRAGERVTIHVRSNLLDLEQEAAESLASGGLLITAEKGDIALEDLNVLADFGEVPQGMQAWLIAHGLPGDAGDEDDDGDGQSNAAEYEAGTSPNDSGDRFRIMEVTRFSGTNFIKFGPIRPARSYTIRCSENLVSDSWSNIGQVTPGVTGDHFLFGHPTPSAPSVFYRLEVHAP